MSSVHKLIDTTDPKYFLPKDPYKGNFANLLPLLRKNPYWVASGKATLERLILRDKASTKRARKSLPLARQRNHLLSMPSRSSSASRLRFTSS